MHRQINCILVKGFSGKELMSMLMVLTMCMISKANYQTAEQVNETGPASKSPVGNAILTEHKQNAWQNSANGTLELLNRLPDCMNVTVKKELFHQLKDSLFPVEEGPDNHTVNFCIPLSPQLFDCTLMRILPGQYRIKNYSLFLRNSTYASLGDYYIDNDGSAISCDTSIDIRRQAKGRCNYLQLKPSQYDILQNGSMQLIDVNILIKRPRIFLHDSLTTTLCYPLSIRFLNCNPARLLQIKKSDTKIDEHFSLVPQYQLIHYSLGEYVVYDSTNNVEVCIGEYARARDPLVLPVHIVFYCISTFALLLTLICQQLTSKSRCHDKCFCCYICSLLVYFPVLITIYYLQYDITHAACYTLFIVHYLSAMSTYFWMGISAFDVWRYFGRVQQQSPHQRTIDENRRFIYYATFVWGTCILLYSVVIALDQSTVLQQATSIKPGIWNFCWFQDSMSTWIFYYGILSLLSTMNLIFLIGTICNIYGTSRLTRLVRQRKIQLLKIYAKLFIIMGISWVIRAIMYSVRHSICFHYWLVSEGVTCLQGIAVFLVYICSQDVYRQMFSYIRKFIYTH